jgi:hypothetical protein
MTRSKQVLPVIVLGALALGLTVPAWAAKLEEARIYIEYNETDNDLGFHIALDGEDWKELKIINPRGRVIFEVEGEGGYEKLGMTELFFEGAEPTLDDFPLEKLLAMFPEGRYRFVGETVEEERITGMAMLTHDVPAGPVLLPPLVNGNTIVIEWEPVDEPAEILPDGDVEVVAYQVIVESFQVTVPAEVCNGICQVTLPPEFAASLEPGEHEFEVLAINESGNQTISAETFEIEE